MPWSRRDTTVHVALTIDANGRASKATAAALEAGQELALACMEAALLQLEIAPF